MTRGSQLLPFDVNEAAASSTSSAAKLFLKWAGGKTSSVPPG